MSQNPSFNGSGASLVGENPVNDPNPRVKHSANRFSRSYPHITTMRYADMTPFYVENGVEKDTIPLNSRHEVRTETMISPFLGDLICKKSYFDIPFRAIYPLNYDLMKVPPVEGDDIPEENTAYIPADFFITLNGDLTNLTSDYLTHAQAITLLFLLEKFFSRGSLFERLGCHLSASFRYGNISGPLWLDNPETSFDLAFEKIVANLFNKEDSYLMITKDGVNYVPHVAVYPEQSNIRKVSIHYILELLRENPVAYNPRITNGVSNQSLEPLIQFFTGIGISQPNNINIERLIAYQLAMIEYSTDDHIDNIYSTDKFRSMMTQFVDDFYRVHDINGSFVINGVNFKYDCFSSKFWTALVNFGFIDNFGFSSVYSYIWNLLSIRKSLRFEDYFVGGRLHPLAMGDVNAPVVNGEVNAYEITRSQVYQRFLNSVNLSGPEFDNYEKKVIGNNPPPRTDVPKLLAMTRSNIRGYEVENTTSENQGALVTNVRSDDERFAFDVYLDHESILIGVMSFEARRLYSKTCDRHFFHVNRYDRFIPGTQYLGDQDISLAELRVNEDFDSPFAYGVRNGEYKQRIGIVSGGVVDFLKSWTMVTDTIDSYDDESNLNSDYIRSKNVEFDRFFGSMTNNSDAGYFHFIVSIYNISEPIRPMDIAPNVLV